MVAETSTNGQAGSESGQLDPDHLADLKKSGLHGDTIRAAGLYTERDAQKIRTLLNWKGPSPKFLGPCLIFPYMHPDGSRNGYARLKPSKPRQDKKANKPIKYEAPKGSGNRIYIPPGTLAALADPAAELLVTEGEKKSLAADQSGRPCIGIPGVWSWVKGRPPNDKTPIDQREMIPDFDGIAWTGRLVTIVFDSDAADNENIQWAEWHLAQALQKRGAVVKVARIPKVLGDEKVGIDDYLRVYRPEEFASILFSAKPPTEPEKQLRTDGRPVVMIGPEEHKVITQVIEALAKSDPNIYQRGGQLVRTIREPNPDGDGASASRIAPIPAANLRTRITRFVQLAVIVKKKTKAAHPPEWLAPGIAAATAWRDIRPLTAISPTPVLRKDGSILQTAEYDSKTGVIYEPRGDYPAIPDSLTQADAAAAAAVLSEVVCDFPFEAPEHKSAWVAGVLTTFARFAYRGPAPLFLVDANVRAAGKSLLADAAGIIAAEANFARRSYPNGRDRADEMRKAITALAIAGERLVLLDNLPGFIGDSSLDAALTTEGDWSDRILGHTQTVRVPLLMTWWATGNNVTTEGDTSRRVLPIRLLSPDEHPEQREGFRHPDLLAWVRQERGRLVAAALTILAGYIRAGRPDQRIKPWGSFEGWSRLVRSAVVWAGLPDPRTACTEFISRADTEAAALGAMLEAWPEVDPTREGMTVGKLLTLLKKCPDDFPRTREALTEFCPARSGDLPMPHALGVRFRKFARRNIGGRCFESKPGRGGVAAWFVAPAAFGVRSGGDGGDGGDKSLTLTGNAPARADNLNRNNPTIPTIPPNGDFDVEFAVDGLSDADEGTEAHN
jgi:hypothetical protein